MTSGKLEGTPNIVVEISWADISTNTLGTKRSLLKASILSASVY